MRRGPNLARGPGFADRFFIRGKKNCTLKTAIWGICYCHRHRVVVVFAQSMQEEEEMKDELEKLSALETGVNER